MTVRLVLALTLVACSPSSSNTSSPDASGGAGGGGGGGGGSDVGGGGHTDAATSGVPATITISGQAIVEDETSATPQAGAAISIYAIGDDATALSTATTDGSGNYSIALTTHGQAIDGYIKATKSGLVDTYVYPPTAMAADYTTATASMISTSNYSELVGIEGGSTSNGVIILIVLDATLNPVQGAKVASSPSSGETAYMNSSGEPFSSSSTYTDGLAFLFDVPTSGTVTLDATKSGSTFASHAVTARGGKLTTTLVVAQ